MRTLNYKAKKCEKCGNEFVPRSATHVWCDDCLTKICEYCGEKFHIGKKSKYETMRFCSVACKGKYQSTHLFGEKATNYKNGNRTRIRAICGQCGKIVLKEKQFVDKFENIFCNRECQIEYYRTHADEVSGENSPRYTKVDVRCEWCGKIFKTYRCVENEARFCSKGCRNDWQSDMMKGENHFNWRGGRTEARQKDMVSREYKAWRKAVFERDNYTCQMCGDSKGGNLRAHHIKPYSEFPLLRYDVNNGITYCEKCHIKVHSLPKLDIQSELSE